MLFDAPLRTCFRSLLAAAAIAYPLANRAAAQRVAVSSQTQAAEQSSTDRGGFGASFRDYPWAWILGVGWAGYMFLGPGG
jgi:hypothetical protein